MERRWQQMSLLMESLKVEKKLQGESGAGETESLL